MLVIKNLRKINNKQVGNTLLIHVAIEVDDRYLISIVNKKQYAGKDILLTINRNTQIMSSTTGTGVYHVKFEGYKDDGPKSVDKYISGSWFETYDILCGYIFSIVESEF